MPSTRRNAGAQQPGAPQDTRGFIYLLTFIMGIGVASPTPSLPPSLPPDAQQVLLPWNAFITASDYFGRVFTTVTT